MTVIVESKRMKVTQALRSFIEKQAQKITKLNKNATKVRVHLETTKRKSNDPLANMVTFLVEIPGKDIVITKHAVNMYDAVVDAAAGAARQLRKKHEKQTTKQRNQRLDKAALQQE